MARDTAASVYVGRPCYHGLSQSSGCHAKWWTSARYSETVVESLRSVLTQLSKEQEMRGIVLFGYSGGGTLAMLLAERLPFVKGVVTIAGNLDIEAWAQYHAFTSLTESLNPVSLSPFGNDIVQIHVQGRQDTVVPLHVVKNTLQRQGEHSQVIIEDVDHQCCWETMWPKILDEVNLRMERRTQ